MSAVPSLLEQVDAARAGIDEQITVVREDCERRVAELVAERDRLDGARQALGGGDVPTRPAPRPSAPARPHAFARSSLTPEQVLDWMREHARDWTGIKSLVEAFGLTSKPIQNRLAVLIEQGQVEQRGDRSTRRYRLVDVERATDQPGTTTSRVLHTGKDDQACAPRPVDGSLSVEDAEDADDEESQAPISGRTRRQLEHESRPAPPAEETSSLRPTGAALRRKIEELLRRRRWFPSELAHSLVVPMAEVTTQIQLLRERGGREQGPKVLKHESGAYFIDAEEARAWPLERAA
jgi:hypothetical protein